MASLDHPALGKTGHGGGGTPPGLAANNGPPGQPGSKKNGPMAVKAGNPHHLQLEGGTGLYIHNTHALSTSQGGMLKVEIYNETIIPSGKNQRGFSLVTR